MSNVKFYSTNIAGDSLIIKAFSMKQLAQYFEETIYNLRPWVSICGPAIRQADVDLIKNPSAKWRDLMKEYKVEDTARRLLALGRITEAPSDETVRRWCRDGRFPNAHKKKKTRGRGGAWRIPEGDLRQFRKPRPGPTGPRIRKGDSDV